MENGNVYRVTREEHHWLPTCPCEECVGERERRSARRGPARQDHILLVPPAVAFAIGLTDRMSPAGSVARMLGAEHEG